MKLFNIIFAIVALSIPGIEKGYAQQFYSVANARYLDSVEQDIANYICNDSFRKGSDMILSISAYQFLAITLVMSTIIFYYQRSRNIQA